MKNKKIFDININKNLLITTFAIDKHENSNNIIGSCQFRSKNIYPLYFNWEKIIDTYKFLKCYNLTVHQIIDHEKKNKTHFLRICKVRCKT